MAAFRIILWPLLLVGAGIMWILFVGITGYVIPPLNNYILQGVISQQTVDSFEFQLMVLSMLPGIIPFGFGAALIVRTVSDDTTGGIY